MAQPKVSAIRCVEFNVPDLEQSARFYEDAWCLTPVARDNGTCYFRATGPEHNSVILHESSEVSLAAINFAAPDKAAVDGLHAIAQGLDVSAVTEPAPLTRAGGGYGYSFRHNEGWTIGISSDVEPHTDTDDAIDRPTRFSHIALHSENSDDVVTFFVDNFGFILSDQTAGINFMRCDTNHHSLGIVRGGTPAVHHVSYELPNFDALMRGVGRMKEMGYPLEWGVGRHGPGDNIFSYFVEPHGFMNEYTAEMLQVDNATYKTGDPEQWARPENRMDQWGFADPPSDAMNNAHGSLLPAA